MNSFSQTALNWLWLANCWYSLNSICFFRFSFPAMMSTLWLFPTEQTKPQKCYTVRIDPRFLLDTAHTWPWRGYCLNYNRLTNQLNTRVLIEQWNDPTNVTCAFNRANAYFGKKNSSERTSSYYNCVFRSHRRETLTTYHERNYNEIFQAIITTTERSRQKHQSSWPKQSHLLGTSVKSISIETHAFTVSRQCTQSKHTLSIKPHTSLENTLASFETS